jgi:tetratricopeptide (TPR) repeat protein
MSKVDLKAMGFQEIHISFDASESLPEQTLRYLFMRITRDWNIHFKVNKEVHVSVAKNVLNFVIIDELERYQYYTSPEMINMESSRRTILIMYATEKNINMINSLSMLDLIITQPFVTPLIRTKLEKKIRSKEKRLVDYRDQYRAKDSIDMEMFEPAIQILREVYERSPNQMTTFAYLSEAYQGQENFEESFSILQEGLSKQPNNYYLLKRMYFLLVSGKSYANSVNVLNKLFNNFLVDGDILRTAVSNAIAIGQYTDIENVLEYIYSQEDEYKEVHKRVVEVSLFIFVKHLIITNQPKLVSYFLGQLMKEADNKDILYRIVDTSLDNDNNALNVIIDTFNEDDKTKTHALYALTLSNIEGNSKAQIINRSKELIDLENVKQPRLFEVLLEALDDVGNKNEYDKYKKEFKTIRYEE